MRFLLNFLRNLGVLLVLISCQSATEPDEPSQQTPLSGTLKVEQLAEGLTAPLYLAQPPGHPELLFVLEHHGRIRALKDGRLLPEPVLDIRDELVALNQGYDERGLLGMAFHPDFAQNGRVFLYYSAPADGANNRGVLAEFRAAPEDPLQMQGPLREILSVEQPEGNHNGGQVAFGPQGYLYLGLGDGGGAGDKHGTKGNGQDTTTLLGSIIRIDVDGQKPYQIPEGNPLAGSPLYAWGLRNPWRFSFDPKTDRLFCGDVGQNEYEEVSLIEKGKNYGWRLMEGKHCFNPEQDCRPKSKNLQMPLCEYPHSEGISVTGGYLYRGEKIPELQGKYLFGDWQGPVFLLEEDGGGWQRSRLDLVNRAGEAPDGFNINSFGRDQSGELYIIGQKQTGPKSATGVVYRVTDLK